MIKAFIEQIDFSNFDVTIRLEDHRAYILPKILFPEDIKESDFILLSEDGIHIDPDNEIKKFQMQEVLSQMLLK